MLAPAVKAKFPKAFRFLFKPKRFKAPYGGRGGAKSWQIARALLILGSGRKLRILCARETQKSIADSVHTLLSDQIEALGLSAFYVITENAIRGKNGTEFIFAGLKQNINNLKSYEGCDIVWVEEAATVSKKSWDTLIPTIRKDYRTRGGHPKINHVCEYVGCCSEIWLSFNPELDTDDTYVRFVVNQPKNADVVKVGWRDNPWFPEVLRIEKDHLELVDHESYLHVWEGECRSAVSGAIFAEEMKKAQAESRITQVSYNRNLPVDTVWDLGFGDKTAIWFVQACDGWFNFIDYLEDEGQTIHHYLIQLQNKGYMYGFDYLPHDALDTIIHKNLAADKSRSIEGIMRSAGRNVRMVPKTLKLDQINAARMAFPQCRFDQDKCYEGLRALRMYQWGKAKTIDNVQISVGASKREPQHDDASHGASAFQYACWSVKQPRNVVKVVNQQPFRPASAWS